MSLLEECLGTILLQTSLQSVVPTPQLGDIRHPGFRSCESPQDFLTLGDIPVSSNAGEDYTKNLYRLPDLKTGVQCGYIVLLYKVNDVIDHHHPPASELRALFSSGRRLSYKKGEIIQHANEIPQGIYFLYEGFVREFTLSNDGEQHLTLVYEPGEIFSVNWMFLGILPNVYRQAHTDTVVYLVSEKDFKNAVKNNHELHAELTYLMMKQVHLLSSRVENLTFSNAYDKVAYLLIHLAGRFGDLTDEGWYIRLPFRHQQIAEALSMSRETASRMIARMEKNKLIKQNGKGHFILRNPSALAGTIGVEEVLGMWPQLAQNPPSRHKNQ